MFVRCECCVLSGRCLCDELITRLEESHRLWRVVVRDLDTSKVEAKARCRAVNTNPQWVVAPREYIYNSCPNFHFRIHFKDLSPAVKHKQQASCPPLNTMNKVLSLFLVLVHTYSIIQYYNIFDRLIIIFLN